MIIIPSQFPPNEEVTLSNGIKLSNGKKIELKYAFSGNTSSHYHDSIHSSFNQGDLDQVQFKDWLLFHSFIFGEPEIATALNYFQKGYEIFAVNSLDEEARETFDYSDIAESLYEIEYTGNAPKISYLALYDLFLGFSTEQKVLIKNLVLLALDDEIIGSTPQRKVVSDRYWRIVAGYSVIERLIGEQPSSCDAGLEAGKCPICEKGIKHRPLSDAQWTRNQLSEFIHEPTRVEEYLSLINAIKNTLRNPVTHGRSHPQPSMLLLDLGILPIH